jgi:M6 family metalloprotease-like protein
MPARRISPKNYDACSFGKSSLNCKKHSTAWVWFSETLFAISGKESTLITPLLTPLLIVVSFSIGNAANPMSDSVRASPLTKHRQTQLVQRGGLNITSIGSIRTLLVFVQFNGDTSAPDSPYWPVDHPPAYFNTFIDGTEGQHSTGGNLTHYYRQMSFDKFILYGDPYFVITQQPESHYRAIYGDNAYGAANKEVLQTLDSQIDYTQYDNWTFTPGKPNGHHPGPDGIVDFIIMYYRSAPYPKGQSGIAVLGHMPNLQLDGRTIKFGFPGSGITNNGGTVGQSLYSVRHEIGHLLFGGDHPTHGESPCGGLDHYAFWGILSSGPHYSVTAFERERLGWINFIDISSGIINKTVPDFLTTGVAYRVLIPGTNQEFIVENHQKILTGASAIWDDPNSAWPGKGLFIYRISDTTVDVPNYNLASAEGGFDWTNPYWVKTPTSWHSELDSLPVFRRGAANRNGLDGRDFIRHSKPYIRGGCLRVFVLDVNGQPMVHERLWGDEKDAFNIGYNQVFSPWSNQGSKRVDGTLTDIAVEITGKSTGTSGEDIFNVTFYNGNATDASPSKPQNVYGTKNSQYAASLTWLANGEPDVTTGGGYNVYRAIDYVGAPNPTYARISTSIVTSTAYVDNNWTNTSVPQGSAVHFRYRIAAVDNTSKESVKSDSVELLYTYQEYLLGLANQQK